MADYLSSLTSQADTYQSQMQQLAKQLAAMTPVTAGEAYQDLSGRVGNFAPQFKELRGLESQAMAAPASLMQQYQQQYGGTTGPDPMARLAQITQQLGNISGTKNVLSDTLSAARARLEDLANQAVTAYGQRQSGLAGQYANAQQMWNQYNQLAEGERQRQFQAAQQAQSEAAARKLAALQAQVYGNQGTNQGQGGQYAVVTSDINPNSNGGLAPNPWNTIGGTLKNAAGAVAKQPVLSYSLLGNPLGTILNPGSLITNLAAQKVAQIPQVKTAVTQGTNYLQNLYNQLLGKK